jgi:hypothetical protein
LRLFNILFLSLLGTLAYFTTRLLSAPSTSGAFYFRARLFLIDTQTRQSVASCINTLHYIMHRTRAITRYTTTLYIIRTWHDIRFRWALEETQELGYW